MLSHSSSTNWSRSAISQETVGWSTNDGSVWIRDRVPRNSTMAKIWRRSRSGRYSNRWVICSMSGLIITNDLSKVFCYCSSMFIGVPGGLIILVGR
jgi:hypothetical protein